MELSSPLPLIVAYYPVDAAGWYYVAVADKNQLLADDSARSISAGSVFRH